MGDINFDMIDCKTEIFNGKIKYEIEQMFESGVKPSNNIEEPSNEEKMRFIEEQQKQYFAATNGVIQLGIPNKQTSTFCQYIIDLTKTGHKFRFVCARFTQDNFFNEIYQDISDPINFNDEFEDTGYQSFVMYLFQNNHTELAEEYIDVIGFKKSPIKCYDFFYYILSNNKFKLMKKIIKIMYKNNLLKDTINYLENWNKYEYPDDMTFRQYSDDTHDYQEISAFVYNKRKKLKMLKHKLCNVLDDKLCRKIINNYQKESHTKVILLWICKYNFDSLINFKNIKTENLKKCDPIKITDSYIDYLIEYDTEKLLSLGFMHKIMIDNNVSAIHYIVDKYPSVIKNRFRFEHLIMSLENEIIHKYVSQTFDIVTLDFGKLDKLVKINKNNNYTDYYYRMDDVNFVEIIKRNIHKKIKITNHESILDYLIKNRSNKYLITFVANYN